ncbi:MAG: TetR/AcrR family transcriptional regulator [Rhodospirillales bacterium]|nr:TetR/AcrR family transcriptional regulator [Rhodospirillales bacterium]
MNEDLSSRLIVDTALHLAEEVGWQQVKLHAVADRLGVPLTDVLDRFRDLDAVANAWLLRGLYAMLTPPDGFAEMPARDRIFVALMRWFDALAGHRRVTGEIIAAKAYPLHPHHWGPMIFNLSRTIQWLRDVARLEQNGFRRQVEEIALTALFLSTLAIWLCDHSPGQRRTRDGLARSLDRLSVLGRRSHRRFCLTG